MRSAADVVFQGRLRDDPGGSYTVAQVDNHRDQLRPAVEVVNAVFQIADIRPGTLKPPYGANDTNIIPHC